MPGAGPYVFSMDAENQRANSAPGAPVTDGSGKRPVGTPFAKGRSGNPKGRPKKEDCLTSILKAEMENICPITDKDGTKLTWKEMIVKALLLQAVKGNAMAMKEVWERVDGKVKDKIEVEDNRVKVIAMPVRITNSEEWAKTYGGSSAGA